MDWSKSNRDLKCIFIAGNEPFTQGSVDFRDACHAAATKGITVSTIFCGGHEEGISTMWAEGAKLADGSYMSINQNEVIPAIASPQDQELTRLSAELNKTYLAYGDAKMMTKQRGQVQEQIKQLSGERDKYVAEQLKLAKKSDSTLDVAIIEAVRKQAEQKQFQFEK